MNCKSERLLNAITNESARGRILRSTETDYYNRIRHLTGIRAAIYRMAVRRYLQAHCPDDDVWSPLDADVMPTPDFELAERILKSWET